MVKKVDIQRFIIWLSGSVTVFGFIATLVAYLIYGGSSSSCDTATNPNCNNTGPDQAVDDKDNTILKIIGPVFMVAGVVTIVLVRCWQNNTTETVSQNTATNTTGEGNGGFERAEFDFGSPPSYSEAIHMRIVVEGQVNFPAEPPPKYDDALASADEEPPDSGITPDEGTSSINQPIIENRSGHNEVPATDSLTNMHSNEGQTDVDNDEDDYSDHGNDCNNDHIDRDLDSSDDDNGENTRQTVTESCTEISVIESNSITSQTTVTLNQSGAVAANNHQNESLTTLNQREAESSHQNEAL